MSGARRPLPSTPGRCRDKPACPSKQHPGPNCMESVTSIVEISHTSHTVCRSRFRVLVDDSFDTLEMQPASYGVQPPLTPDPTQPGHALTLQLHTERTTVPFPPCQPASSEMAMRPLMTFSHEPVPNNRDTQPATRFPLFSNGGRKSGSMVPLSVPSFENASFSDALSGSCCQAKTWASRFATLR